MVNRRAYRRTKVQRQVEIEPLGQQPRRRWLFNPVKSSEPASGQILDIGVGGMRAEFPVKLDVGTPCDVRIRSDNGEVQHAEGTVRSYRADNGTKAVGIAFKEPLLTLGDPAAEGQSVGYDGAEPTAVIVDDDPGVLFVLERFLRKRGLRVKTAANGGEALEILRHEEPALLMIDLKMPSISGVQLLEQMKAEGLRASHVWAMSGCVTDDEAFDALSMGAAEFFDKPFDLDQLDSNLRGLSPML
jgi:CheY-like chemotaxis protein